MPTNGNGKNGVPLSYYKKTFLEHYVKLCVKGKAATAAGVTRRTVDHWIESDKEFKEEFESAKKGVIEMLEAEAIRRAYDGIDKPVFYKGKQVSVIQEYSDLLLIFLLKANDPAKYRERYEISGAGGGSLEVDIDPKSKLISALDSLSARIGAAEGNKQTDES
ncbi:MAG: terminase [Bacteroidetes bacterium]|nr:terminase [Bacteroidota bacterium]